MTLFMCSETELNAAYTKYQETIAEENVSKREILTHIRPSIDAILRYINDKDRRFSIQELTVGDHFKGFKQIRSDHFELSLPLELAGEQTWTAPSTDWHFGFAQKIENEATTSNKDLQVVVKNEDKDPHYGGHGFFRMSSKSELYADLSCNGFIIPYLVKQRLSELLLQAVENTKDDITLSNRSASVTAPLTISFQVDLQNIRAKISVEIIVMSVARLRFKTYEGVDWPRQKTLLMLGNISDVMCGKLVEILQHGVDLVAVNNFYWTLSFVVAEKLLCRHIDGDGGCRRKVLKLMKAFLRECNLGDNPIITSFEIKNVWLWECERRPSPNDWKPEKLTERFFDCMQSLCHGMENQRLKNYFCNKINLFKSKEKSELEKFLVLLVWQELGGRRAFGSGTPVTWESLPIPLRNISTLGVGQFKMGLKSYFFQQT